MPGKSLQSINDFFDNKSIAVAGVSRKKQKFGNSVYKELAGKGFSVFPVNPKLDEFEGARCYHSLSELPDEVKALVICTKNDATLKLISDAKKKGLEHIWLQQGCIKKESLNSLDEPELNIIAKECVLMFAGPVKGIHGFHRFLKKTFGSFPS